MLYRYILATKGLPSACEIVNTQHDFFSDTDGDVIIEREMSIFTFSDGITLKKIREEDNEGLGEQVCKESWIGYEVIDNPQHIVLDIQHKNFTNTCQESFWLKMHTIQSEKNNGPAS